MPFVTVDRPRPHVAVISIDRQERLNALSFDTVLPLHDAIRETAADHDVWIVILTGAGRAFCSGLDLEDHGMPPGCESLPMSRIAIRAMEMFAGLVPALRRMPQPVIAAINGPAIGGGLCLSLGADLRIADESALFRNAGINNGLTGTELGASWLLPRLIGAAKAWDILLTGRDVTAAEALAMGLVSRVVPDAHLLDEALRMAEAMCAHSPHGLAMTKKILWSNLETSSLEAGIDLENRNQLLVRMTTMNLQEAITARKQKRKPRYED